MMSDNFYYPVVTRGHTPANRSRVNYTFIDPLLQTLHFG